MALSQNQINEYLKKTKTILLSTVTEENKADVRILGAIATDGVDTYFSTQKDARKVSQIESNPNVALYFEAPGQAFPNYINATVYGKAQRVTDLEEIEKAKTLIKEKLPHFEFSEGKEIFVVKAEEVKIYNSSAELAQDKIQVEKY